MRTIGFVGVGLMGKGMIKNLATKMGEPMIIWNRSPEASEEMKTLFGDQIKIAATAADVVKQSDITYCMLSTEEASAAVFDLEGDGVIAGVSEGKVIVDCATLSRERMIDESARIAARGGLFLEAPVSGSKAPAEQGTLIFLCGGDQTVYDRVGPDLDAMGKARYLFGPVGKGTEVKLVVNMIMGGMMTAFAEGLALGKANDIPLDKLIEVLDQGAMSNPMFRGKGPLMAADNFGTNFPLKHQQKDMRLALELAKQSGVDLPTATAANGVYEKAMAPPINAGDDDFSGVIKAI
jgi:3-hydroxyisobutyrate dehydrogenase-like beta-hydroxyacid dehydrogenase